MKIIAILITCFAFNSSFSITTNEVVVGGTTGRYYDSDYGTVEVHGYQFKKLPDWDTKTKPPVSLEESVDLVRNNLPAEENGEWLLQSVELTSFDNYSQHWYYIVEFHHRTLLSINDSTWKVVKKYVAVVLMDGNIMKPIRDAKREID